MAKKTNVEKLKKPRKLRNPGFFAKFLIFGLLILQIGLLVTLIALLTNGVLASGYGALLAILIFLIDVFFFCYIINSKSEPIFKITWMFFVLLIPIFGALMYVLFANKATSRRQKRKYMKSSRFLRKIKTNPEILAQIEATAPESVPLTHYLENTAGGASYGYTKAKYYALGDYAFDDIMKDLKSAKHFIFLEFFIIAFGKFWDSILEILKEKVAEGVDVRLMYDDIGSLSTLPSGYAGYLRSLGIKAFAFEPVRPLLDIRQNNRDHRKILVVDGLVAYTGGCNLADEYINEKSRFGHWKDNFVRIEGEAVHGFTTLFLTNWLSVSNLTDPNPIESYEPRKLLEKGQELPETNGFFQPYGDLPYDHDSIGENVYLSLIRSAKKTLDISTPYLILDSQLTQAIKCAAKSGVRIRILMPHIPDKKAVFQISRSYYGELIKNHVEIYEYTPGFVHEKVFVVDNKIATIGTFNLDYRSLVFHLECGLLITDSPIIADVEKDFDETFARSERITKERWGTWHIRNMFYWALLRIVSPLL